MVPLFHGILDFPKFSVDHLTSTWLSSIQPFTIEINKVTYPLPLLVHVRLSVEDMDINSTYKEDNYGVFSSIHFLLS